MDTNPYSAPKAELNADSGIHQLYRHKKLVVADPESEWPDRCIKCNSETDYKKKLKLYWVNPWFYITILIAWIITIILVLIFRKKFDVKVGLCEEHRAKRTRFILIQWALFVAFLGSIFFAGIKGDDIAVLMPITLFLILVLSSIFGRMAIITKYKNDKIWVKGAGKDFLDSLPEYSND